MKYECIILFDKFCLIQDTECSSKLYVHRNEYQ